MRPRPPRALVCSVLFAVAALTAATGCSPGSNKGTPSTTSTSRAPGSTATPPGAIEVSPGGTTTKVDVQANSTEDEYFQACHAAKLWMDAQTGPRNALFEPYLAMLQASASGTAGSWNVRWTDLPPARQAAVIVAAQAAAAEQCG